MIYYLEDHVTYGVLLTTDDVFLMNNIRSGILDCYVRMFSTHTQTVDALTTHGSKTTNDTGIKIVPGGVFEFSLDSHPEFKKKQELVKIRKVAFDLLLDCSRRFRTNNNYGFSEFDMAAIEYALSTPTSINEYATVMNMSPEFAQQELSMLRDSFHQDNFRIFTVCKMWKERINRCETKEEIAALLGPIRQSFWVSGIPNV